MIRKFKHKQTGWIASGETDKMLPMYDRKGARVGEANLKYIEGHDDWQEMTDELVKGLWYVADANGIFKTVGRYHYIQSKDDIYVKLFDCYRFESSYGPDEVHNKPQWIARERITREATSDEIHQALDAIRIEKGLVEGIKIYPSQGMPCSGDATNCKLLKVTGYISEWDELHGQFKNADGIEFISTIYHRSQWASKVEPILITEDGVEKFDGDKVYKVYKDYSGGLHDHVLKYPDPYANETLAYFHNKENAQAYIENHRPRYSKADLEWLENEIDVYNPYDVIEFKTKIKYSIQNLKFQKNERSK